METIRTLFLIVGAAGLIIPALLDFVINRNPRKIITKKKTAINAMSILGFFILIGVSSALKIGVLSLQPAPTAALAWTGAVLIVLSSLLNCIGRIQLGKYWSDEISVFKDHQLITTGVFRYMRHPLFSALIGLAAGISMLYCNLLSVCLTMFICFPALFSRARMEERMLAAHIPEYIEYMKKVPMFCPLGRKRYVHD